MQWSEKSWLKTDMCRPGCEKACIGAQAARLALAIMLLAACGAPGSPSPTPAALEVTPGHTDQAQPTLTANSLTQSAPTPQPPTLPPASPTPTPEPADIVLQREGGPSGESHEWRIYRDGRVQSGAGRAGQVQANQVEALLHFIQSSGFFSMAANYQASNPCCDRFTYRLSVRTAQGTVYRVTAVEGASEAPAVLWEILKLVEQLADRALAD